MAGRKIGTVFVELGLDSTEYTRGEAKILQQSMSTSLKMEENFRTLGTHSDLIFNKMKENVTNAYQSIANSSKSSATEIIRAEEAKNAKIKALNDQQFGSQKTLIENLKTHWIAAAAAIGGAMIAIGKAREYIELGAKALQVESAFEIMAESADVNGKKMIASMRSATKETVDSSDLMQKAIKLMIMGYNPEQVERFSKVVTASAIVLGTDVTEAYERLADALATKMPRALVQTGAVTRDQMSIVKKAVEAGADSMALYSLAMLNLEKKTLQLQGTQNEAIISLQRFKAHAKENAEFLGMVLIRALQITYGNFQLLASGIMLASSSILFFSSKYNELMGWLADKAGMTTAANNFKNMATAIRKEADLLALTGGELAKQGIANIKGAADVGVRASREQVDAKQKEIDAELAKLKAIIATGKAREKADNEAERATKQMLEAMRKANYEIATMGWSQYQQDVARIESEAEKYRQAGVDKVEVAKFVAVEIELAAAKAHEVELKLWRAAGEAAVAEMEKEIAERVKVTDAHLKGIDEYEQMVAHAAAFSIDENQRAINEILLRENEWLKKTKEFLDLGYINEEQYNKLRVLLAENSADAILKIRQKETRDAADFFAELQGYSEAAYNLRKEQLQDEWVKNERVYGEDVANARYFQSLKAAYITAGEASDSFATGAIAGMIKIGEQTKNTGQMVMDLEKKLYDGMNQLISDHVDAFISGENMKLSTQEQVGKMMSGLAGSLAKEMFSAAIGKVVGMIGAYIGLGASASGGAGAMKGGVAGALTEIGIYLGIGVASMLAGRGLAQAFNSEGKAQGGWVASHPGGGWLSGGSGTRDDIYLGMTPGVRHWGMGGEFVVNKDAAQRHAQLLYAINSDRGHAEGGPVGDNTWESLADILVIGTAASALHGFWKGGPWGALAEAVAFNVMAIGGAFAGKALAATFGNMGFKEGGMIDRGHGFGDFLDTLIDPFHILPDSPDWVPDPRRAVKFFSDPSAIIELIKETVRAPYKNVAQDILTPYKLYSNPLHDVTYMLQALGSVIKASLGFKYHSGGVVGDDRIITAQTGEGIVSRRGMANLATLNFGHQEGGPVAPGDWYWDVRVEQWIRDTAQHELRDGLWYFFNTASGAWEQETAVHASGEQPTSNLAQEAEAAETAMMNRGQMLIRLMELEGNAIGALSRRRSEELIVMDESLRVYQTLIWAWEDHNERLATAETNLRAAFDAERTRLETERDSVIEGLNATLDTVRENVRGLTSDMNMLVSARESMRLDDQGYAIREFYRAQADLFAVLRLARTGDLSGIRGLGATLESVTGISTGSYSSAVAYQRDYWRTYNAIAELESLTGTQLTAEERMVTGIEHQIEITRQYYDSQIAALDTQLNTLLGIQSATVSMADAINAYLAEQAWVPPVLFSQEMYDMVAAIIAETYYQSQNNPKLEGARPSRTFGNRGAGSLLNTEELVDEVRKLREELGDANFVIAKNTGKFAKLLDRWDGDGMPGTRSWDQSQAQWGTQ